LENCEDFGIGLVPAYEVDSLGIVKATEKAMARALDFVETKFEEALIDGKKIDDFRHTHKAIVGGDSKIYSISAASIVAKVFRDRLVSGLDNIFLDYGFSSHKGYGTAAHYKAISRHGLTPEHRKSFLRKLK